ncbi:MAG: hypothetical protein H7A23_08685 [Leptospiraceae bacterium]|nr:hypothetical protein [Leptospiraceae bacterium]MCP5494621.1 hypothetical protein [Leptospiraceae bacterium]
MRFLKSIVSRYKLHRFIPFKKVIIKVVALAFIQKQSKVYTVIECSKNTSSKKLCLFANYDGLNKIHDYVIYNLQKIKELNFEILLIVTSKELPDSEIRKVSNIVDKIIFRENIGYDFGSWKKGLEIVGDYDKYEQIFITNDSVYGPIYDLGEVFETMEKRGLDMWGLTDSFENRYHAQSYFLVFSQKIIQSEFFKNFWNSVKYYPNALKSRIIQQYEIGLSRGALKNNFQIGAYIGYYDILEKILELGKEKKAPKKAFKKLLNPTLLLWKELLMYSKSPYLKVDLIKSNPLKFNNVHEWYYLIKDSTYDRENIINHLKHVLINPPKK